MPIQLKGHYSFNCSLQPNIDIEKLKGNLQKIFANVANNWKHGRLNEELKKVKRSIISEKIIIMIIIVISYYSYSLLSRTIFSHNFQILNAKPGGVGGCGLKPNFS